jgi:hypothetical protein
MRYWVWGKVSKELVLGMHFLKHVNMPQWMKKIYKGLKYVLIKATQWGFQKCVTWPKKSRKRRQEWNEPCVNFFLIYPQRN